MNELQLTGFELIEKLGEGGMGHVWKARQLSLDRIVAIKLLPPRFSNDPESVRQIIQEARIAAKLKHHGIVQVYDANEQNGTYYFVMEFVDGYNVGQWIARKKALGVKDALIVVESVAAALKYAWHTSGLIHCDLKPENIMVDRDGSIKVADLGLSVTRDAKTLLHDDEVAGSPGYISPEQVTGGLELDCRTDIYSLGCCLYHMVTGIRPFHELADSAAMESHVSAFIPDPRDCVPSIPGPVCALIERMLVKKRENRLKDWHTVVSEIHRVQRGISPAGPHPDENASTMRRKQIPTPWEGEQKTARVMRKEEGGPRPFLGLLIGLLAVAGGLWWLKSRESTPVPDVVIPLPTAVTNVVSEKSSAAQPLTTPALKKVEPSRTTNPGLAAALDEIQRVTDSYLQDGAYNDAIRWLENYFGQYAQATVSNRTELIAKIRKIKNEAEMSKRNQASWQALASELAGTILTGKYSVARQSAETALKQDQYANHRADLVAIEDILQAVGSLNDKLLETFSREIGKVTTIPLARGEFVGRVVEVRDRRVSCRTMDGAAGLDIRIEDMAPAERVRRLALLECPEAYLVRGVNALNAGQSDEALGLLSRTGPVLGPILLKYIQGDAAATGSRAIVAGDAPSTAFLAILRKTGSDPGKVDASQWMKIIGELRLSAETSSVIERDLESFLVAYGKSAFAENNAELILSLQKALGRAATQESSETQAAPAGRDDAASYVISALLAKNPAMTPEHFTLDTPVSPGKISLRINSPDLIDLSPIAEFKDIVSLTVEAPPGSGTAALDVAPLAGLPLKQLSIRGYDVSDISRLKGMKLSRLMIPGVTVRNFSFLQGMPLTALDISRSQINDLSVLQGMRLEVLHVNNTKVASITALSGMPLRELELRGTQVRDITYLQGLPLERLDLSGTPVFDFSPLRSFKLTSLAIADTCVRDLTFCMEMPLTELDISGTSIPSLGPLTGKKFSRLALGDATIRDLSAFKSIKVSHLDLAGSKLSSAALVTSLSTCQFDEVDMSNSSIDRIDFLRNSRALRVLNLSNVKVYDLSPLERLPIEMLNIRGVPATEISSLRTLTSLKVLETDLKDPRLLYVIKASPSLAQINGQPVRDVVDQLTLQLRPRKEAP